jgi:hypothetical protein
MSNHSDMVRAIVLAYLCEHGDMDKGGKHALKEGEGNRGN